MRMPMVWVKFSLFCNKANWGEVLKDIYVFLHSANKIDYCLDYCIQFNYLSGENIRLAMLCEEVFAERLAEKINRHFTDRFAQIKKTHKVRSPDIYNIFMPFPTNTIQNGLYQINFGIPSNKTHYDMYRLVSEAIIFGLKDEMIDDEILMTFHIILLTEVLNSLIENNSSEKNNHPSLLNLYEFNNKKIQKVLSSANEEILDAIITRTRTKYQDNENKWLLNWSQFCSDRILKRQNMLVENGHQDLFNEFEKTIMYHLGISKLLKPALDEFLQIIFLKLTNRKFII